MTSTEVSCFLESAYKRSFSSAAESLHIAPQAVSKYVRSLESALNTSLFVRKGKSLELTDSGRHYFSLFSSAVISLRQILSEAQTHNRLNENRISLGISEWIFPYPPLQSAIERVRRKKPTLRVDSLSLTSEALVDMVQSNRLDMAFLPSNQYVEARGVESRAIWKEDIRLMIPSDICPPNPTPEELKACCGLPLLMPVPLKDGFFGRFQNKEIPPDFVDLLSPPAILNCSSLSSMALEMQFPRYAAMVDRNVGLFRKFDDRYRNFPLSGGAYILCIWSLARVNGFIKAIVDEMEN